MPAEVANRRAVLATGNAHKVDELAALLKGWDLEAFDPDVEETGDTFEANSLIKADAAFAATGQAALADDSGIVIDGMGGRPGIHSARWTAEADWIPRVLRELEGVSGADRSARYVAAAAYVDGARREVVLGAVEGHIAEAPRGTGGFGYDPIFVPAEGDGRTFAEMTPEEKQAISHRARAFLQLIDRL